MDIKTFLQLTFLISSAYADYFDVNDVLDVDTKSSFCGRKLGNILSYYCEEFFESSSSGHSGQGIVDFCCSNPCTPRKLMENYCKKTKKIFNDILMLKQSASSNGLLQEGNTSNAMSEKLVSPAKTKPVSEKPGRNRCLRRKPRRRNCRNISPSNQNNTNSSHPLNIKREKKRRKCTCCKEKKTPYPSQVKRQKPPPRPANVGFDETEPQTHIFLNQATYDAYGFSENI